MASPRSTTVQDEATTAELRDLRARVDSLESVRVDTIYISSLGDATIKVQQPIPITIRRDGEEFIASFLDANVSTGGADLAEAVSNLQSLLADIAPDLLSRPDESLGKSMRKQKRVLAEFLCPKS